jgi:hypothetical protein
MSKTMDNDRVSEDVVRYIQDGDRHDVLKCGCAVCSARRASKVATAIEKVATAIEPAHYREHPSGIDCIEITEHMNFNLGNAIKYIWRSGLKGETLEDLQKAAWYVNREISRIKRAK